MHYLEIGKFPLHHLTVDVSSVEGKKPEDM